jgi:hypothetical protein
VSDTLKATPPVAVGDIFENNWGYNQTNIDYYEVVAVSKTGRIKLHRIHKRDISDRNEPTVKVSPIPGSFLSNAETTGYRKVEELDKGKLWVNLGYRSAGARVFIAGSEELPTASETGWGWGH